MTADTSDSWAALRGNQKLIGQRLGRYRISASLGHGGMAEVFRASDERLGREVAIKVVLPAFASDAQLLQRFLREARVVASLDHPNILPIYDFGDHEGLPYLVLPLIRGGTLADVLDEHTLEPARIAGWVRELAQALDAAHAAGVLHRDIKPGNVLVGRDEHLFLADFGIARLSDATRLTRTGTVVGTPVYMAPEVASGKPAEAASDLYSLAVMSYEMLAGRAPFEGENVLSILHQHATSPVPPITGYRQHLSAGVDRVFEQAMAKHPAERPASCRVFADLLTAQLPAHGAVAPPSDLVPTLAMTREPTAAPAAGGITRPAASPASATVADDSAKRSPGSFSRIPQRAKAVLGIAMVGLVALLALKAMERPPASSTVLQGVEDEAFGAVDGRPADPAWSDRPAPDLPSSDLPSSDPPPSEESGESPPAGATGPTIASPPVEHEPTQLEPPPVERPDGASPAPDEADSGQAADVDSGRGRLRFNDLRSLTERSSERDFERAREAARRMPARGPLAGQGKAVEIYARGGLAYLAGDDDAAAAALRQALRNPRFVKFWGPGPLMLLASESDRDGFEAWELALGYGDARGTAADTLDAQLLEQPEDPRLRVGRALIHRLDGESGAVIRYAVPVYQQLGAKDAPEARGYLAQIIGDAYLDLDRGDEALEWYRRAFAAGGSFRGVAAMRGAEAALELRRPSDAEEFLTRGCEAGLQAACRRLEAKPRWLRD